MEYLYGYHKYTFKDKVKYHILKLFIIFWNCLYYFQVVIWVAYPSVGAATPQSDGSNSTPLRPFYFLKLLPTKYENESPLKKPSNSNKNS